MVAKALILPILAIFVIAIWAYTQITGKGFAFPALGLGTRGTGSVMLTEPKIFGYTIPITAGASLEGYGYVGTPAFGTPTAAFLHQLTTR